MIRVLKFIPKAIASFLPHILYLWMLHFLSQRNERPVSWSVLERNRELKNRHLGERCFVLGNGPSVRAVDLSRLKGETIISVSNGYLHRDYSEIRPKYHCVPQTHPPMTDDDVARWFGEMDAELGSATLFLNETENQLVCSRKLFERRDVRYLDMRADFDQLSDRQILDLTKPIPRVQSVPVMVLIVAMYLGFKEIYLLGVDHDHFINGTYEYAFELKAQRGKDDSVSSNGEIVISRYDDFQSLARLWRQYRVLREIAAKNDVKIFNATPGGVLDEFQRVDLDAVLTGWR